MQVSSPKNLVEDVEILLLVKFRWILLSCFRGEVENVSANQKPRRPSCFLDRPENTNLLEDVEVLIPVKFRWILLSDFRGEVENVSVNLSPGRPFCFSDRPEKHKLSRGRWDLASCHVSLNSVQWFQRGRNVSANQRSSWFSDLPEKHKLGKGCWDLASCKISLRRQVENV